MKLFRILAVVVILGAAAYAWVPPFRLFALVVAGRSPVCPMAHALKSKENADETIRIKDRFVAASRLVRQDGVFELWDTPKGQFWVPKGNRFVLPFNLAEVERHIYGSGEHFIHPGDVVLDCGASDGDFTREALRAGAAKVISVEIAPLQAECLRRTLAPEIATGRVVVYPKGVWDREDRMTLNQDDTNFAADSVVLTPDRSRRAVEVPLTTIDRIVEELGLTRVDFIKMDVEGAEVRAIAGARQTVLNFRPRLAIATEHKPDDERTIPAAVRQLRPDYRMECGQCLEEKWHVRPDVLFFY